MALQIQIRGKRFRAQWAAHRCWVVNETHVLSEIWNVRVYACTQWTGAWFKCFIVLWFASLFRFIAAVRCICTRAGVCVGVLRLWCHKMLFVEPLFAVRLHTARSGIIIWHSLMCFTIINAATITIRACITLIGLTRLIAKFNFRFCHNHFTVSWCAVVV